MGSDAEEGILREGKVAIHIDEEGNFLVAGAHLGPPELLARSLVTPKPWRAASPWRALSRRVRPRTVLLFFHQGWPLGGHPKPATTGRLAETLTRRWGT